LRAGTSFVTTAPAPTNASSPISTAGQRIAPPPIAYPVPHVSVAELSPAEINDALISLPGWTLVTSPVEGKEPLNKTELHKRFEFSSFERAMKFMVTVASEVTRSQHHPRWENTWRTVGIWLSTWDIGHKPSQLDIQLANVIEKTYRNMGCSH